MTVLHTALIGGRCFQNRNVLSVSQFSYSPGGCKQRKDSVKMVVMKDIFGKKIIPERRSNT